ncbi:unnamed protein product [Paramecium sonneborni]|uniref:G domain-containing protein n=1 Tax=Paramecium sonneborni TaxID=65129 RepID=A0A8S1RJF4_9CILI|nr:unnamed protein product [Paramecium sonneborni]
MNKKQIVLIGFTGSGKTTFFNLICKTQQLVQSGGNSVTRQTFLKASSYGSGFRVLDTPGFGSKQEKIIHAVGVLNALSEGPVHQIFLIVKWERLDMMQDFIKNMVTKFMRYRYLLTVTVTHWDTVDKSTVSQNKQQVIDLSKSYGINSVIFVSKYDPGEKICQQIDSILNKCEAEQVELTETEFYSNFDLLELQGELELSLECTKGEVIAKFRRIATVIKKFIEDFDGNNSSIHEIMHYLTLETKAVAENLISDFEIKNNAKFSQLYTQHKNPGLAYLIHFELKKELVMEIEEIIKLTQLKMKDDKAHFFNFIKACPHCGLIWLKVSGCEGETTCGAFPIKDEYFHDYKMPQKYEFKITENGINYKVNQVPQKQENKIQLKSSFLRFFMKKQDWDDEYKEPPKENLKGCGRKIVWDQIPDLSYQQLKILIDPGVLDYFAKEVPKEELKDKLIKAQLSIKQQVEQAKIDLKVIKLVN